MSASASASAGGCPMEALEAWSAGTLPEAEAARVAEHVRACPLCAEEIAWLRAEKRLFEVRAAELPGPPAFADVLARAAAEPRAAAEARAITESRAVTEPPPPPARAARPARLAQRKGERPWALRAATFIGLAAAAAFVGILLRSGEAPQPVVVSPEPPPPSAVAPVPLEGPPFMGEPEHAGGVQCSGASVDTSAEPSGEPDGPCGSGCGAPPEAVEVCGTSQYGADFSVTCGGDRPLEE